MHDPSTMIHQIKIGKFPLVTIWHIDPEIDGSDDSCGWFRPKLTEREEESVDEMADWDMGMPYFSSPYLPLTIVDPKYDYNQMLAGDCLSFVAWTWSHIAWSRDRRKKLTIDEWWDVVNLSSNPRDNIRSILANPGDVEHEVKRFFYCVMKAYLGHHRPWWKHPRWHIHHWQFQVHFIQTLKRWLFSRCAHCEERFSWGYFPIASWDDGQGPRWFRSERGVFHHQCYSEAMTKREKETTVDFQHPLSDASGHPEDASDFDAKPT